jgi:hypothetical protein
VNNADKPLHLQYVQVKVSCDGDLGDKKPVIVKATCPEELYDSSYGAGVKEGQSYFTIPSAASAYGASKPVRNCLLVRACGDVSLLWVSALAGHAQICHSTASAAMY